MNGDLGWELGSERVATRKEKHTNSVGTNAVCNLATRLVKRMGGTQRLFFMWLLFGLQGAFLLPSCTYAG